MHYETACTIVITIIIVLAGVPSSDALTCSCSCCTDKHCTLLSSNNYTNATCQSCKSMCQRRFSSACTQMASHVAHQCTNSTLLSRLLAKPDWIGIFRISDGCDPEFCCCLTDVVHLTRTNNNNLHVRGQFTGECPRTLPVLDDTFPMPNEFSTELRFLNQMITVTLAEDSSMISFMEPDNLACRYRAVRENAASMSTMNWFFIILLSSFVSMKTYFI